MFLYNKNKQKLLEVINYNIGLNLTCITSSLRLRLWFVPAVLSVDINRSDVEGCTPRNVP